MLGVDIGTSSLKTALFDTDGKPVASAYFDYTVDYPKQGWAEQNPDKWWEAACCAIKQMLETQSIDPSRVCGLGLAGQSWSAIAVDKEGRALCPTPIWMDTRASGECAELKQKIGKNAIFDLCGNPMQPSYTLPKIIWYKKNLPEVFNNTWKILQSNSYIAYKMTGVFSQDISQSYGLHLFDMKKGIWDADMARSMGISLSLLPDIVPCHEIIGSITAYAAKQTGLKEGTPVVAGGLDAACGTLGAGVVNNGQTQEQGGQAGGMSICMDECKSHPKLILSFHVAPGKWLLQGGTVGGAGAMKWLKDNVLSDLSYKMMDELALSVNPGSDGLVFLPYMSGERSPIWNPKAKGVLYGLDYAKSKNHIIRAVMEGTAYSLRHNLDAANESGAYVTEMNAMGGAANSSIWMQIKADITQKTINTVPADTATTMGAAILAGMGIGVWRSFEEAVNTTIKITGTYKPNPNNIEVYEKRYNEYLKLYENLVDMMV